MSNSLNLKGIVSRQPKSSEQRHVRMRLILKHDKPYNIKIRSCIREERQHLSEAVLKQQLCAWETGNRDSQHYRTYKHRELTSRSFSSSSHPHIHSSLSTPSTFPHPPSPSTMAPINLYEDMVLTEFDEMALEYHDLMDAAITRRPAMPSPKRRSPTAMILTRSRRTRASSNPMLLPSPRPARSRLANARRPRSSPTRPRRARPRRVSARAVTPRLGLASP